MVTAVSKERGLNCYQIYERALKTDDFVEFLKYLSRIYED